MSSDRPKKPSYPPNRRAVVEGARRAIQDPDPAIEAQVAEYRRRLLDMPADSFTDGVHAERHLREHVCPNGESPLGPWIPQPDRGVSLVERDELVRFQPHLVALFKLLTPERAAALGRFVIRLTEGQTVGRWWRAAWKIGAGLVVTAFAAARWGVDQIPLLKDLANLWKGHSP